MTCSTLFAVIIAVYFAVTVAVTSPAGSDDLSAVMKRVITVLRAPRGKGRQLSHAATSVIQRVFDDISNLSLSLAIGGAQAEIGLDGDLVAPSGEPRVEAPTLEAIHASKLLVLFSDGPAIVLSANEAGRRFLVEHPDVVSVTEDVEVHGAVQPIDRYSSDLAGPNARLRRRLDAGGGVQLMPAYNLDRIDQTSLPLDEHYRFAIPSNESTPVDIFTIDSGVRASHVELAGRINLADSINVSPDQESGDVSDCAGHGTHIAGTMIGATVGVSRSSSSLIVVRVYGAGCRAQGPLSNILAGFSAVIGIINRRKQPAVCDLSFATPNRLDLLDQGTAELSQHCIVVTAGET